MIVALSFPLKKRIGGRNWRRLHWATYSIFALSTAHGLAAGDRQWAAVGDARYLGAVGAVAFATAWRALAGPSRPATAAQPRGATHVQDPDRSVAV